MTSRLRIAGLVVEVEGDAGEVSETVRELAEFLRRGRNATAAVDDWQRARDGKFIAPARKPRTRKARR